MVVRLVSYDMYNFPGVIPGYRLGRVVQIGIGTRLLPAAAFPCQVQYTQ